MTAIRRALGGLLACLLAPAATAADVSLRLLGAGIDANAPRTMSLEPIGLRDLGLAAEQAGGTSSRLAHGQGHGLTVSAQPPAIRHGTLVVQRQLPIRWQLDVPTNLRFSRPSVRVESEGPLGQPGLFLAEDGGAPLSVRVRPGPETVVAREAERELVEGEVWVEFALDEIRRAGTYRGRLVFTLEHL